MSTHGTILLVAVDDAFKAMVAEALRPDEHTIVETTSGSDAVAAYERVHPDLVIFDLELPGADGLDTCRTLVAAHREECAPIVFFAVNAKPTEIAAGFGAGATDYLTKAASAEEIRARVRSYLDNYVLLKQQMAMAEQLSRANAAKNRFIGMAAHDMRNPLVSIRGFSEFLLDGTLGAMPPVQLALVSIIHGTSNLMIKTLNELLDVATIEAGQLKLQLATHNFVELAAKAVAQSKIEARKKRSRVEFIFPDPPVALTLDADKMKQVFDNLLSNAIKFSPAASVITAIVETAPESGTCSFSVRDQGPGIPEEARDRLFKPFGTVGAGTSREDKTAGVGLIITRNIVEAHRGTIAVSNLPERGCEFRVTLTTR